MTDLTMSQFASKDDLLAAQAARIAELEGSVTHLENVYGAAIRKVVELEQGKCLHQIAEPAAISEGEAFQALSELTNALREGHYGRMPSEVQAAYDKAWTIVFAGEKRAPVTQQVPAHPDDAAVDALAALMKAKLTEKRAKGYGGWNDKTQCPQQRLSDMLRAHVDKGDPVDVANFCAMLSARGEGIAAAQQAVQAAVPEAIEQMAEDRYKVVPSHESMFHRWAVVAGNGTQQLYAGREVECQNVARKFTGAFLDGAFAAMQNTSPAHPAVGVPDARAARQITDAIVENFKDAGWSMPSIDEARVLEAVSAAIVEHGATDPLTGVASDVDSMARVLMAAFSKAEPEHPITRYPTSFVATFADMARAALAATQPAAQGMEAEYQRGYQDGYNRRDAEVKGALV